LEQLEINKMAQDAFTIGFTGCLLTAASLALSTMSFGTELNLPKTIIDGGSLLFPVICLLAYITSQISQDNKTETTPCSLHLKNMFTCLPPIFINIIRLMPLFFKNF